MKHNHQCQSVTCTHSDAGIFVRHGTQVCSNKYTGQLEPVAALSKKDGSVVPTQVSCTGCSACSGCIVRKRWQRGAHSGELHCLRWPCSLHLSSSVMHAHVQACSHAHTHTHTYVYTHTDVYSGNHKLQRVLLHC